MDSSLINFKTGQLLECQFTASLQLRRADGVIQ